MYNAATEWNQGHDVAMPPEQSAEELDLLLKAVSVVRGLNNVIVERDFSVARHPRTRRILIVIRNRASGDLIDVCQPGDVANLLPDMTFTRARAVA